MQVEGRCALVTGAGSGLGRATARDLHSAGAKLVLVDINRQTLDGAIDEVGTSAIAAIADVRDADQVAAAVAIATETFGALHVVVNCAGISSSAKVFSRGEVHDLDLFRRVIDINLTGTFNVMCLAAAAMSKNTPDSENGERGVIVNTASVAAFDGQKGQAAYAASKAGVAGLTLPVARDLADQAIRCVTVAPGLFETELFEQIPEKGTAALKRALLYPERMGRPSEFAAFVRHVVENPYVNGSTFRLDGGARLPA